MKTDENKEVQEIVALQLNGTSEKDEHEDDDSEENMIDQENTEGDTGTIKYYRRTTNLPGVKLNARNWKTPFDC